MIIHQAKAQYQNIVPQQAQCNIIHRHYKILTRLENIILLQRFAAHMIIFPHNFRYLVNIKVGNN